MRRRVGRAETGQHRIEDRESRPGGGPEGILRSVRRRLQFADRRGRDQNGGGRPRRTAFEVRAAVGIDRTQQRGIRLSFRIYAAQRHCSAVYAALISYNEYVARGWESKSVQEQIASARLREGENPIRLTAVQIETERKCDSLLLQRTRMLRQIETCGEGRYRQTLQDGLEFLEKQLTDLGWRA